MMVAVLLGALSLGACVDDNESASVTAIRNAKAAQLEALANYANAQAESELIIANAEAAIKAAQAAYEQAEAKWMELENQEKEMEIQKAQAALETEIEAAKAKAEAALIAAQAQLEQAKAALIMASDQADNATQAKIQNLINAANAIMYGGKYEIVVPNYTVDNFGNITSYTITKEQEIDATESLIGDPDNNKDGLKLQLVDVNASLVTAQYDLEDTKVKIQQFVEAEKVKLAKNEALLKAYNDNKTTNLEDTQKALDEVQAALPAYIKANDEAWAAYQEASYGTNGAITKAEDALDVTELCQYLYSVREFDGNSDWVINHLVTNGLISQELPDPNYEVAKITYEDGTYVENNLYYQTGKWVLDEEATAAVITNADRELAIANAELAEAKKEYTDGTKADNAVYKAKIDAVTNAQKAFDEDPTESNKQALTDAEDELNGYINGLQSAVDGKQNIVDQKQANLDVLKEVQTKLSGDIYKAYETVYDAYVAAFKASVDPYIAYCKANYNYSVQYNLAEALGDIIDNKEYTDWASLIEGVEADIRTNNKNIAAMTDNGKTTGGETEASRQAYIDALTVEKASLEQEIAIKQAQYDNYIEQVKALIGDTEEAGE